MYVLILMIMISNIYIRSSQYTVADFHTIYCRYHRMIANLTIRSKYYLGSLRQINMGRRAQTGMISTPNFPTVYDFTIFSDIQSTTGMYIISPRIIEAKELLYNVLYAHKYIFIVDQSKTPWMDSPVSSGSSANSP